MNILSEIKKSARLGVRGNLFQNIAVLALGTGSAKLVGLLAMPLLTRLYSPENFGVLSVYTALVMLLSPLVTLRYVMAIPLPKSAMIAANIFSLCIFLNILMTLLLLLVLYEFGPFLLMAMSMDELINYWWFVALGVIGASLYETLSLWATRDKAFRLLAKSQIYQMFLGTVVKVGIGLFFPNSGGLLLGQIVQQSSGSIALSKMFSCDGKRFFKYISLKRMSLVFIRYIDYAKYRTISQFFLVFSIQSPILFASGVYGSNTAGQLSIALMAISLPAMLIVQSASRAYYSEISRLPRTNVSEVRALTRWVAVRLFIVAVPVSVLILFFGEYFFVIAFGNEWAMAGRFASVLAIYLPFQFASSPVLEVFNIYGGQKKYLYIYTQRAVIVTITFFYSYIKDLSMLDAALLYSVFLSLHYGMVTWRVFKLIRVSELDCKRG